MSNLSQLWADEMNGKVPAGTYRSALLAKNGDTKKDPQINLEQMRKALEIYAEESQWTKAHGANGPVYIWNGSGKPWNHAKVALKEKL